jgi:hypothetical protein
MRKIKLVVVALAATAGLLATPAAATAATTRPAESVYTTSSLNRCFNNDPASPDWVVECVDFQAYSTYSATQVWINGHVTCHLQTVRFGPVPVDITWCGVGGGNGTGYLNIGVNWNVPDWHANNLYERMNIVEGGEGCTTFGTNSAVGDIYGWSNKNIYCEVPA